jgi:hypothetical protein
VQEVLRCLCACCVKLKIPSTFFHGCVLLQKSNEEPGLSLQLRSASAFAASFSLIPRRQTKQGFQFLDVSSSFGEDQAVSTV